MKMSVPTCSHCGSSAGYGFDFEVDIRLPGAGCFLENGEFVVYSLDESDIWYNAVRVVNCTSKSITCLDCGKEITDKDFIQKVVDSINEGLSN